MTGRKSVSRKGSRLRNGGHVMVVVRQVPANMWNGERNSSEDDSLRISLETLFAKMILFFLVWWVESNPETWKELLQFFHTAHEKKLADAIQSHSKATKDLAMTVKLNNPAFIMKTVGVFASHGHEYFRSMTTETKGSLWGQVVSVHLKNTICGPSWEKIFDKHGVIKEGGTYSEGIDDIDSPFSENHALPNKGGELEGKLSAMIMSAMQSQLHQEQIMADLLRALISLQGALLKERGAEPDERREKASQHREETEELVRELNQELQAVKQARDQPCKWSTCLGCGAVVVFVLATFIPTIILLSLQITPQLMGGILKIGSGLCVQDTSNNHALNSYFQPSPDHQILDTAPELHYVDLITWKNGEHTRQFRLINFISSKCDKISTQLQVPKQVYDGWVKNSFGDACHDLIQRWLESGCGPYPVTWSGLIQVLRDVELEEVAKQLKRALLNKL